MDALVAQRSGGVVGTSGRAGGDATLPSIAVCSRLMAALGLKHGRRRGAALVLHAQGPFASPGSSSSSGGGVLQWRASSSAAFTGGPALQPQPQPQQWPASINLEGSSSGPLPTQWQQRQQQQRPQQPESVVVPNGAAWPTCAAAGAAQPSAVEVTGTVHRIQFRAADTAYTVLKVKVSSMVDPEGDDPPSPRRGRAGALLVTVVGALPPMSVGQAVRFRGAWTQHPQYGRQLRAAESEELRQQGNGPDLVAYLSGGLLPGVGPVTAQRMVAAFGTEVESVLDAPDAAARLQDVPGVGRTTAGRIKRAWDETRGVREGVAFLRQWLPPALAHKVAQRHGPGTRASVEADPYATLAPFGVPLSKARGRRAGGGRRLRRCRCCCRAGAEDASVRALCPAFTLFCQPPFSLTRRRTWWRRPAARAATWPAGAPWRWATASWRRRARGGTPICPGTRWSTRPRACWLSRRVAKGGRRGPGGFAVQGRGGGTPSARIPQTAPAVSHAAPRPGEQAAAHGLPWDHSQHLHLVAQHMHATGLLVAEPPPAAAAAAGAAAAEAGASGAAARQRQRHPAPAVALPGGGGAARAYPAFATREEAKAWLAARLPGVAASCVESMLQQYREAGVFAVLDLPFQARGEGAPGVAGAARREAAGGAREREGRLAPEPPRADPGRWASAAAAARPPARPQDAVRELSRCKRIGPKTAEKIKLRWEASHGGSGSGSGSGSGGGGGGERAIDGGTAGAGVAPGLTMQQLADAPPSLPFAWSPATRCFAPHLHAAELTVAARTVARARACKQPSALHLARVHSWLADNERRGGGALLNEGQRAAVQAASDAPLMVVTGGPGCGKTTAVATIVKLWAAQGKVVRLAAPTGRAAQRMGRVQGIEPCTIHRLLRYTPAGAAAADAAATASATDLDAAADEAGAAGGGFEHHARNPLPADAVLVDEASMLSLPLAAALLDALRPGCQLVLVGDVDQLPPVGPGSVLHSLLQSRLVPVVELRQVFRQAAQSAIVTNALAVRRGEPPCLARADVSALAAAAAAAAAGGDSSGRLLGNLPSDALLVPAPSPEALPATVQTVVMALRGGTGAGNAGDLQVITPMRKGPAGTHVLNPLLQVGGWVGVVWGGVWMAGRGVCVCVCVCGGSGGWGAWTGR